MSQRLVFDQEPQPVPKDAVRADPAATIRSLYQRIARLEQELEQERVQRDQERREALSAFQELLNSLLTLRDHLSETVERLGVTTNAREAAIMRRTAELDSLLRGALSRYQVEPIRTVGKPLDETTSVAVGASAASDAPPGTVVAEEQIGYRWPHGVVRRARVVVSEPAEQAPDA
jgi:molecular chaperone GrpE (heat shock protein)